MPLTRRSRVLYKSRGLKERHGLYSLARSGNHQFAFHSLRQRWQHRRPGQREFQQIYPQGGWVEHDPFDILTSQLSSVVEVLGKAGIRPRDLAAVGITNQRETTIVWDRETGKPVYNAIVWQDRRTAERCHQMKTDGTEETVRQKTGLLIDPYFSSSKIAWILDNVDGAREQAEAGKLAFGTVDSWLIWNLTSGKKHITDRTNASRTMLYNIVEDRWDADLLKLFGIPESMMPEVVWSSEKIGQVTTSLGLEATEIAGIAGDQQSALFGQLCIRPGDAKNTYGTGCFLLQNIGDQFVLSQKRLITTLICSLDKKLEYALEGSIFIGGAVVQWLRDNLHLIRHSSEVKAIGGHRGRLRRSRPGACICRPGSALLGPVRDGPA